MQLPWETWLKHFSFDKQDLDVAPLGIDIGKGCPIEDSIEGVNVALEAFIRGIIANDCSIACNQINFVLFDQVFVVLENIGVKVESFDMNKVYEHYNHDVQIHLSNMNDAESQLTSCRSDAGGLVISNILKQMQNMRQKFKDNMHRQMHKVNKNIKIPDVEVRRAIMKYMNVDRSIDYQVGITLPKGVTIDEAVTPLQKLESQSVSWLLNHFAQELLAVEGDLVWKDATDDFIRMMNSFWEVSAHAMCNINNGIVTGDIKRVLVQIRHSLIGDSKAEWIDLISVVEKLNNKKMLSADQSYDIWKKFLRHCMTPSTIHDRIIGGVQKLCVTVGEAETKQQDEQSVNVTNWDIGNKFALWLNLIYGKTDRQKLVQVLHKTGDLLPLTASFGFGLGLVEYYTYVHDENVPIPRTMITYLKDNVLEQDWSFYLVDETS